MRCSVFVCSSRNWYRKRAQPGGKFYCCLGGQQSRHGHPGCWQHDLACGGIGQGLKRSRRLAGGLDENFQIRRYSFDTRLRTTGDFDSLDFKGRASSLIGSTRNLGQRFSGRPFAGILVFSDGNATDIESLNDGLGPLPRVLSGRHGKESDIKDISITSVQVTSSTFEDAPVSIHCNLAATGFPDDQIEVRLLDPDGTLLDTQLLDPSHLRLAKR
ncbi:MAG: hypothetical protein Ct9H300mP7_4490 [Verrucomicrobiota bacterium]|nr:MAG: hypothetical protein Ct9H300mP7_4490 [Verrucomicrobiota bacterium]